MSLLTLGAGARKLRSLPRLRGRVGERVSPQWDNPPDEEALSRATRDLSRKRERCTAGSVRTESMKLASMSEPQ